MSMTWGDSRPTVAAPPSSFGDAVGPDPRVGRGPWPLAPLTVPLVVLVATLVSGVLLATVVPKLPWAEDLRAPGMFTSAFVLGLVITGALGVLSLTSRARPAIGRLLVGSVVTAGAFAAVATIANAVTESLGFELRLEIPNGFFDDAIKGSIVTIDQLQSSWVDQGGGLTEVFDTFFSVHLLVTMGLLFAVLGTGAAFASGGTVRTAVLAGLFGAAGAAFGEALVAVGFTHQIDWFIDDRGLPTALVLAPWLLGGLGIGIGALIGRPHGTRPTAPAPAPAGTWSQAPPPPPAPGYAAAPPTEPVATSVAPAPATPSAPVVSEPGNAPVSPAYTPPTRPVPATPPPGTGEPPPA